MSHIIRSLFLSSFATITLLSASCSNSSDAQAQSGINSPEQKITATKTKEEYEDPGTYSYRGVLIPVDQTSGDMPEYFYLGVFKEISAFDNIGDAVTGAAIFFPETGEHINMQVKAWHDAHDGFNLYDIDIDDYDLPENKRLEQKIENIFNELAESRGRTDMVDIEAYYLTSDTPGASSIAIICYDNEVYGKITRNGKEYIMTSPDGEFAEVGGNPIPVRNIKYDKSILAGPQYSATNLFDNNYSTCWAVAAKKAKNTGKLYKDKKTYTASFDVDTDYISQIVIYNGYQKSDALFMANDCPTWIRITAGSEQPKQTAEITLYEGYLFPSETSPSPRNIYIWRKLNGNNNIKIYLSPDAIRYGSKYDDICISEIEIY